MQRRQAGAAWAGWQSGQARNRNLERGGPCPPKRAKTTAATLGPIPMTQDELKETREMFQKTGIVFTDNGQDPNRFRPLSFEQIREDDVFS